jgi:hypothetical protein
LRGSTIDPRAILNAGGPGMTDVYLTIATLAFALIIT